MLTQINLDETEYFYYKSTYRIAIQMYGAQQRMPIASSFRLSGGNVIMTPDPMGTPDKCDVREFDSLKLPIQFDVKFCNTYSKYLIFSQELYFGKNILCNYNSRDFELCVSP